MPIVIFGGTFDPPHLGHRAAVEGLFRNPGVDRVVVLPAANPPLKIPRTSAQDRLEMVRRTFQNMPDVEINELELERSRAQPDQPQYSYDTMLALQGSYGGDIALVIGADQLETLPSWSGFPEVLRVCHWIVLERKGHPEALGRALQRLKESGAIVLHGDREWRIRGAPIGQGSPRRLTVAVTDAPMISSTYIREALTKTGLPPADCLHPQVAAYLKERKLYGSRVELT